ncbi:MAG: hypothetical protein Q9179_003458 [Wetmoreana sp. 5 TL-2023]
MVRTYDDGYVLDFLSLTVLKNVYPDSRCKEAADKSKGYYRPLQPKDFRLADSPTGPQASSPPSDKFLHPRSDGPGQRKKPEMAKENLPIVPGFLDRLPNELLFEIVMRMPDFTSLANFITAYPSALALAEGRFTCLVQSVSRNAGLDSFQKYTARNLAVEYTVKLLYRDIEHYFTKHTRLLSNFIEERRPMEDLATVLRTIELKCRV